MTPDDFLNWITPAAKEICEQFDLPYQVVVSQGAIESQWGKYGIGNGGYNLFGRKFGGEGEYVELETEECIHGEWQTIFAKFQSYNSLQDAIKDWCILVDWGPYKEFTTQYHSDHNIENFVRGIGGVYATDPEYSNKVLGTIRACFGEV